MGEKQPVLFIPHGGGPCFFMDWQPADTWKEMGTYLSGLAARLPQKPSALLVVSAHWEADPISITSSPSPQLIYDYFGLPPHTYEIEWPVPGHPQLAETVKERLALAGVTAQLDVNRGLDHGSFIPLKLAFPAADIAVVQLSLHPSLDPAMHLEIGRALSSLREENVLIIGSGMSFHDVAALMGRRSIEGSRDFDAWLNQAVEQPQAERAAALEDWAHAPFARLCHPREEHLLPLHVVVGAAGGDKVEVDYRGMVMGAMISGFSFGHNGQ